MLILLNTPILSSSPNMLRDHSMITCLYGMLKLEKKLFKPWLFKPYCHMLVSAQVLQFHGLKEKLTEDLEMIFTQPKRLRWPNTKTYIQELITLFISNVPELSILYGLLWCMALVFQFYSQLLLSISSINTFVKELPSHIKLNFHQPLMINLPTMRFQRSAMLLFFSWWMDTGC